MADILFTDAGGPVTLSNLKPPPADRFFDWTPDALPIGPSKAGLGTGIIHTFTFREDYLVAFQIRGIPNTELDKMLRLQTHLMDGYIVAVNCDHEMAATYAICALAPDTEPTIEFSDNTELEYTFGVVLKAVDPADVVTDGPDAEPFYPPGSLACVSGLSGVQDWGDDFCPWMPGEYGLTGDSPDGIYTLFNLDAIHSTKYRDPVAPGWDNQYAGYGYYDTAYRDGVPEAFRHIDIVQVTTALGGHRAIEAIKYGTDDVSSFYSMGPAVDASDAAVYTDMWMRMVFQFSAIFPIDDTEGFTNFMSCSNPTGGNGRVFDLKVTKGIKILTTDPSPVPEGDLWYRFKFPSSTLTDTVGGTVATRAEIFDGTQKEVIVRCQATGATTARFRVWFGDAFASLDLRVDESYDSGIVAWDCRLPKFFFGEVFGTDLTAGQQMSCQLIEWEVVDGSLYDVPPVWGTRLGS